MSHFILNQAKRVEMIACIGFNMLEWSKNLF